MHYSPKMNKACQLLCEGVLVLSEVESNGIRVDMKYCKRQCQALEREIERQKKILGELEEVKLWKQKYKDKFSLDSNLQLSDILYGELKTPPAKFTEKGRASVDAEVLESLDLPIAQELVKYRKLYKARYTYLEGIMKETLSDGYLHPTFNLHTVKTYRSSSSSPNWQNIPIRDEKIKKIIRRAIIPRQGHQFGGVDYSGIEIKISACYHQDPTMVQYIKNPESDLHRDMADEIYMLDGKVTKQTRYYAKNKFVFPQFYGDWWVSCAKELWEVIDRCDLRTQDGFPLKEHLRSKGIEGLGVVDRYSVPSKNSFYEHIKEVERSFWYDRFPVYTEWKKQWMQMYEKNGYFDMLTGFRCSGIMGRNDVINYPVQGVAFHCLLWSLIQLHEWMRKEKLKSKIVGQIHDEINFDAAPDELNLLLMMAEYIMCEKIKEWADWLKVPLSVEATFSPVDRSWYEVVPVDIPQISWKEEF